jgi:hypothetical protein
MEAKWVDVRRGIKVLRVEQVRTVEERQRAQRVVWLSGATRIALQQNVHSGVAQKSWRWQTADNFNTEIYYFGASETGLAGKGGGKNLSVMNVYPRKVYISKLN